MADHSRQHRDVVERGAGELQVRDVRVRLDGGRSTAVRPASSCTLPARRLEGSSSIASSSPCAPHARRARGGSRRRARGSAPSRTPAGRSSTRRQRAAVAAAEVGLLVDVRLAAVEREAAHGRHEVDETERDADRGADRQAELLAGLLDRGARRRRRQRILEDVVGVEADLFRLRDSLEHARATSVPGRADQPELEGVAISWRRERRGRRPGRLSRRAGRAPSRSGCVAPVQADEVLDRGPSSR